MGKAPSGRVVGLDDWGNVVNMGKKRGRERERKKSKCLCALVIVWVFLKDPRVSKLLLSFPILTFHIGKIINSNQSHVKDPCETAHPMIFI